MRNLKKNVAAITKTLNILRHLVALTEAKTRQLFANFIENSVNYLVFFTVPLRVLAADVIVRRLCESGIRGQARTVQQVEHVAEVCAVI